ncbi:MAG TPA: folate family ECF transporter S component [Firmicutes bacterium]|nr:folate family ECF transporter S component [Candidatus Fermentithermobacillaceae bacterium]
MRARRAAFTALFIALSVVLTRFASLRIAIGGVEGIRIGLGSLPSIMAGMLLGPAYGFISGSLADVIGFFLSPMGGYMPHFTLSAGLMGGLPGLVSLAFRKTGVSGRIPGWVETVLSVAAGIMTVSWGLTPHFLSTLYGLPRAVIMPPRIVAAIIEIPAYSLIIRAVSASYVRLYAGKKPA